MGSAAGSCSCRLCQLHELVSCVCLREFWRPAAPSVLCLPEGVLTTRRPGVPGHPAGLAPGRPGLGSRLPASQLPLLPPCSRPQRRGRWSANAGESQA